MYNSLKNKRPILVDFTVQAGTADEAKAHILACVTPFDFDMTPTAIYQAKTESPKHTYRLEIYTKENPKKVKEWVYRYESTNSLNNV